MAADGTLCYHDSGSCKADAFDQFGIPSAAGASNLAAAGPDSRDYRDHVVDQQTAQNGSTKVAKTMMCFT